MYTPVKLKLISLKRDPVRCEIIRNFLGRVSYPRALPIRRKPKKGLIKTPPKYRMCSKGIPKVLDIIIRIFKRTIDNRSLFPK